MRVESGMASFGRVAAAPLWVAQLATGAKSFVDNPILGSERLNRAGLHTLRVRLAHGMAGLRRRHRRRREQAGHRAGYPSCQGPRDLGEAWPRGQT